MKNKLFSRLSVITVAAVVAAAGAALPAASFAQMTTTSSSIQAQLSIIASLTQQIQALQQQILGLRQQQKTATAQLVSTLSLGSQGDQVKILQALLAADPGIFPEGQITGFFGSATQRAVKRFQKAHGLAQVGRVGPQTLQKLNEDLDEHPLALTSASGTVNGENENDKENEGRGRPCAIVPPGHLIAPGWLRKHDGEKPIVPTCQTLPPGILNLLNGTTTAPAPTSTPTTTVALSLSNVAVASMATSTATITWNTNLAANSQVMYGVTTAYGSSSPLDSTLVTSHSVMLSGLLPNTTYHFQVVSATASSTATSSDMTFSTNALDVTAPTISAVTNSVASTSASVSWTTNENATGKVFYGTANPLDLSATSTASVTTTSLSMSHSFTLSGLNASTTYFYVIQSVDGSGNTGTSAQLSFTTTQ